MKIRNTNVVTGNATVGSQHDVTAAEGKTKASKKDRTVSDDGSVQSGPHNVASGNDKVSRQVGIDLSNGRG